MAYERNQRENETGTKIRTGTKPDINRVFKIIAHSFVLIITLALFPRV